MGQIPLLVALLELVELSQILEVQLHPDRALDRVALLIMVGQLLMVGFQAIQQPPRQRLLNLVGEEVRQAVMEVIPFMVALAVAKEPQPVSLLRAVHSSGFLAVVAEAAPLPAHCKMLVMLAFVDLIRQAALQVAQAMHRHQLLARMAQLLQMIVRLAVLALVVALPQPQRRLPVVLAASQVVLVAAVVALRMVSIAALAGMAQAVESSLKEFSNARSRDC